MGADHLCALAVVASPGASDVDAHRRENSSADARSASAHAADPSSSARARRAASLRRGARSFLLGVRWSVGHAAGLAIVCAVFFASRRRFDLDRLSVVADKLVGSSMIALGALSLFSLHRWRRRRAAERLHVADVHADGPGARDIHEDVGVRVAARVGAESPRDEPFGGTSSSESKTKTTWSSPSSAVAVRGVVLELEAGSDAHAAAHDLDVPHVHVPAPVCDADVERAEDREGGKRPTSSPGGVRTEDVAAVAEEASRARWSFGIGFVHGLAGPSGILAVLPAVVLEDAAKSTAYLVAFFVASTASMAAFAGAFGAASYDAATRAGGGGGARNSDAPARVAMGLNLFAGCAAIVIGTAWVALSSLGLLGDL